MLLSRHGDSAIAVHLVIDSLNGAVKVRAATYAVSPVTAEGHARAIPGRSRVNGCAARASISIALAAIQAPSQARTPKTVVNVGWRIDYHNTRNYHQLNMSHTSSIFTHH